MLEDQHLEFLSRKAKFCNPIVL